MVGNGGGPPYLVAAVPPQLAGTTWELTRASHIVGRLGDIRLAPSDVSKRHAELRLGSDGVWLSDLGSRNGVLHNGRRLDPGRPVRLSEGDHLHFGSVQLVFRSNAPQAPGAAGRTPHGHDREHDTSTVTDLGDARRRRFAGRHGPDPDLPPLPRATPRPRPSRTTPGA